jgi:hypothetical protein
LLDALSNQELLHSVDPGLPASFLNSPSLAQVHKIEMRLTNILGLVVAAVTVLASASATSEYERSIVSANASLDLVSGTDAAFGDGKWSLQGGSNVDNGEERISWSTLVKRFPGKTAKKLRKENKKMERLRSTHEAYKARNWEPRDVFNALIKKGFTEVKAKKHGLRYESYLSSAA